MLELIEVCHLSQSRKSVLTAYFSSCMQYCSGWRTTD